MKILVIDPRFEDVFGGAREVSYTIAEVLSEEHDVTLLHGSSRDRKKFEEFYDLNLSNIDYIRRSKPLLSKALDFTSRFYLLSKMKQDRSFLEYAKQKEKKFDVVFIGRHQFDSEINLDIPVIQYVHDPFTEKKVDKPLIYRRIYERFASLRLYSNADITIYNSKYTAERNQISGEIVYPPVDEKFQNDKDKKHQGVIVGRIAPVKGIKEAIELSRSANLDLKIIGSVFNEEYYENIKETADGTENIEILTDIGRGRLRNIIEESKIGFSCNSTETFGINVVEYMKAGAVPIAHNAAGPKEIIADEKYLYEDLEEGKNKLSQILENFEEHQQNSIERSEKFGKKKFRKQIYRILDRFG